MNPINTHLKIQKVDLQVNLGWRSKERAQEQGILLDIAIAFPEAPKACETDHLDHTVCYDQLIQTIRARVGDKHYKLVEHLAYDIYGVVKSAMPAQSKINLSVTKFPRVQGLNGGVSFHYGDDPWSS